MVGYLNGLRCSVAALCSVQLLCSLSLAVAAPGLMELASSWKPPLAARISSFVPLTRLSLVKIRKIFQAYAKLHAERLGPIAVALYRDDELGWLPLPWSSLVIWLSSVLRRWSEEALFQKHCRNRHWWRDEQDCFAVVDFTSNLLNNDKY